MSPAHAKAAHAARVVSRPAEAKPAHPRTGPDAKTAHLPASGRRLDPAAAYWPPRTPRHAKAAHPASGRAHAKAPHPLGPVTVPTVAPRPAVPAAAARPAGALLAPLEPLPSTLELAALGPDAVPTLELAVLRVPTAPQAAARRTTTRPLELAR